MLHFTNVQLIAPIVHDFEINAHCNVSGLNNVDYYTKLPSIQQQHYDYDCISLFERLNRYANFLINIYKWYIFTICENFNYFIECIIEIKLEIKK